VVSSNDSDIPVSRYFAVWTREAMERETPPPNDNQRMVNLLFNNDRTFKQPPIEPNIGRTLPEDGFEFDISTQLSRGRFLEENLKRIC
jgi:hypothetical protein